MARAADASPLLTVVALLKREKARATVRGAFPRRKVHLVMARNAAEVEQLLLTELVDAVLVDSGAGDEALKLLRKACDFTSVPFFYLTPLLPADAPAVAQAVAAGVADLLVDGIDEAVTRDLVTQRAFSTRFERALAEPPATLKLETPLQLAVWQSLVKRAGRPVRTDALARELSVSREHLSRSFATGAAPTLKRVIDLVRVLAAAELAKNTGYDIKDVAAVLGFASSSHLSGTTHRLVGAKGSGLTRLRAVDLIDRFTRLPERLPEVLGGPPDETAGEPRDGDSLTAGEPRDDDSVNGDS